MGFVRFLLSSFDTQTADKMIVPRLELFNDMGHIENALKKKGSTLQSDCFYIQYNNSRPPVLERIRRTAVFIRQIDSELLLLFRRVRLLTLKRSYS